MFRIKSIAVILAALMALVPVFALAEGDDGTITTTGFASVVAEPDQARVIFGVELIGEDAKSAQKGVNEVINAATEAIKAVGIEEKQLQTESINIYREYEYTESGRREIGFHASTTLTVSLTDITMTGAVIDAGLEAGLNNVNSVNFSTSKESEYYAQALAMATENALKKGEILAKAANVTLDGLESLVEGYSTSIYTNNSRAAGKDMIAMESAMDEMAYSNGTSVSTGEIRVTAQVTATFEIK